MVHTFWKAGLGTGQLTDVCEEDNESEEEEALIRRTFLQTLRVLYSKDLERAKADESEFTIINF